MLLFIPNAFWFSRMLSYSNTSHVIVYLDDSIKEMEDYLFKYISCYCLSDARLQQHRYMGNSNTSHVIVYRVCRNGKTWETHSNTSHVIVYRHCLTTIQVRDLIQIHLMLLFIRALAVRRVVVLFIQIHLMLLFIEAVA